MLSLCPLSRLPHYRVLWSTPSGKLGNPKLQHSGLRIQNPENRRSKKRKERVNGPFYLYSAQKTSWNFLGYRIDPRKAIFVRSSKNA